MNSDQNAGTYEISWNGKSESGSLVASGVYFYELKTSEVTKVQKMMLLK
jgi:flagellar hook assembly protein FlgD